jgi:CRP/FNR family transcriptional regulator, cyclic AMP receptor protein
MHDWERYRSSAAAFRVNHFMNKFRELGFIDYNGSMEVHSSLLSVVLHDQPHIKKRTQANF